MNDNSNKRSVFYVSDRTGKTAESIGQSLLSQFDEIEFEHKIFPFVSSESEAQYVASEIQKKTTATGNVSIVFSTLVNDDFQQYISSTDACVISLFNAFIEPLEKSLQIDSSHTIGKPHEEYGDEGYKKHMDAIDFTLKNDDGIRTNQFSVADVILLGVSRSAKTPSCLYLAMHFSIKAANYPLTDDDLMNEDLPDFLLPYIDKIIGLTIRPDQLSAIRQQRRPKTDYASLKKCQEEVKRALNIMKNHELFVLDTTAMSIEEIAVNIVKEKELLKNS
ncbi:MAG: kinase/pyrophosphorylase [Proteobacteria bacterium]|nr:kinase/pyrophosphorylase [Pseudomonadota bacterium]